METDFYFIWNQLIIAIRAFLHLDSIFFFLIFPEWSPIEKEYQTHIKQENNWYPRNIFSWSCKYIKAFLNHHYIFSFSRLFSLWSWLFSLIHPTRLLPKEQHKIEWSKQIISTQTTEDSFPKLPANEFAENEAHPEQNLIKVYIDVYIYSLLSNIHIL